MYNSYSTYTGNHYEFHIKIEYILMNYLILEAIYCTLDII